LSVIKTGHPYKLNKAADARQFDYYPYGALPGPPDIIGNDWSQVSYVIGGHRWKARFVDLNGYIVTGDAVQYNFETSSWVGYHATDSLGSLEYDCGPCHTTGYKAVGNQDGLPGMVGTWDVGGIHCEECHGNGSQHIADPHNVNMVLDRSSDLCGQCHVRGTPYEIPASGGFVKHHEQYNEILSSKHTVLECVDCHDPHKSLHPDEPNRALAIRRDCESCHFDYAESFVEAGSPHVYAGVECIDCHMPKAGKSAVAESDFFYGDVRSHLFSVNTLADAVQFNEDGTLAKPYLTLNYMCKNCHRDEDQQSMADHVDEIHGGHRSTVASADISVSTVSTH